MHLLPFYLPLPCAALCVCLVDAFNNFFYWLLIAAYYETDLGLIGLLCQGRATVMPAHGGASFDVSKRDAFHN